VEFKLQTPFDGEKFGGDGEYEDAEELELLMIGHIGATTLNEDFAPRTKTLSRQISTATQYGSARDSDSLVITDLAKKGTLYKTSGAGKVLKR
jgi:hypothetical protein